MTNIIYALIFICMGGLIKPLVAADAKYQMVKIAQYPKDFYVHEENRPQLLDFRLAYITSDLRDQLIVENSIIVDTSDMLKPEKDIGIYKLKLTSDSVSVVFADLIERTGFLHKRYPDCLFIQSDRALRTWPKTFLAAPWKDAKIKPGDIIVLMGI